VRGEQLFYLSSRHPCHRFCYQETNKSSRKIQILYIFTTVFLKVSVGLFLLRVAFERLHILNIWFIMLSSAVLGVAAFFVGIFHCRPLTVGWSLEPHADSCVDISVVLAITYSVSALNVIADWTLGILPIFIVSGLQMSKRQKRIVVGILSFAALGSTATIVRLPYMVHLREAYDGRDGDFLCMHRFFSSSPKHSLMAIPDNTGNLVIWSIVELGVGITAGSLATLRPLLKLALARFGATDSSNDASGHKQHNVRKMNTWVPGEDFEVDHSRGRTTTTITAGTSRSHPGGKKGFGSELDKWTTSRASQITDNSVWKTERVRVRVDEIDRNDVEMGMGVRTFERRRSSWSAIEFDRSTADGSRTYSH
jgi:hypothetical protein